MTDKNLVRQIQILREIKPRKDWVILTKSQILGQEIADRDRVSIWAFFQFRPAYRPVFISLLTLTVLIGAFGFAQISLPGDILYPIKRITERSQAIFVSESELPGYNLEIANKRLEELTKIAETNQVKKLAPAISEFQANVSQAAENLSKAKSPDVKEIVVQAQKLEKNKQKVEALGVVVGETDKLDNPMKQLVEREIAGLETQTLTETQQEVLTQIKEDLEAGKYYQALEKILLIANY